MVCMSTFVSVRSVRAYVGVNVRVNVCVCVCVSVLPFASLASLSPGEETVLKALVLCEPLEARLAALCQDRNLQ